MTTVLFDTHALAWSLTDPAKIGSRAQESVRSAQVILAPTICLYEISQKVRLKKWPQMAAWLDRIEVVWTERGGTFVTLSGSISLLAGSLDWPHRDPFDRMIAATALAGDYTLISADTVFDGLPVRRVW
jgi:PIN domain nuclease of toxin-antitoxin system